MSQSQGGFAGGLETMNTKALDSAWVEILYADPRTDAMIEHDHA